MPTTRKSATGRRPWRNPPCLPFILLQWLAVEGDERPIGFFDSGVGGLSILREVAQRLPHEPIVYVADQAWSPYGRLEIEAVRERAFVVTERLLDAGAKLVVVACNSASAAALHPLRARYPQTPFVGLEPAVKPAALRSKSGVVGVLATAATFQGELFATVVDRHASDVEVISCVGDGLAAIVEEDGAGTAGARELLTGYLGPMVDAGMDTLVLGCTHYPFLIADIEAVVGNQVEIIDPSPAVARQVARVVLDADLAARREREPDRRYVTTGDPERFAYMVARLLGGEPDPSPTGWEQIHESPPR